LKQFSDWTSVYSAAPGLPSGLLRNLARAAGVHIYSETGDAFYAGRGIVALHAWKSGRKAIRLPERFTVREILGGTPPLAKGGQGGGIVQATDRIEFDLNEKETRVFEVRSTSEE
jgi:hypothetical protein